MTVRVGIQMGVHSVFEEGPERVLDRLQSRAGLTEVQVNAFHYYLWHPHAMKGDQRPFSPVWVHTDPARYRSLGIGHVDRSQYAFSQLDVLNHMLPAARERGIKVHARYLEGFQPLMTSLLPEFRRFLQIGHDGATQTRPCWWNPDYRQWWRLTIQEVVETHQIDGVYLGPERDGPMGPLLNNGDDTACFCQHCQTQAKNRGIDIARAKEGYCLLLAQAQAAKSGQRPVDGFFVQMMRLFVQYPEILAWENLHNDGKWSLHEELSTIVRARGMEFGMHICMYSMVWDIFGRVATDYGRLSTFCDYIKPSTYFDVNAARLHGFLLGEGGRILFGDFEAQTAYQFLSAIIGAPIGATAHVDQLAQVRCSADWTRREISRAVTASAGRAQILSGVGIDVPPPHNRDWPIEPALIAEACQVSLEAGAAGLLLSREYEFMRDESLDAVGEVVRSWQAAGSCAS